MYSRDLHGKELSSTSISMMSLLFGILSSLKLNPPPHYESPLAPEQGTPNATLVSVSDFCFPLVWPQNSKETQQ